MTNTQIRKALDALKRAYERDYRNIIGHVKQIQGCHGALESNLETLRGELKGESEIEVVEALEDNLAALDKFIGAVQTWQGDVDDSGLDSARTAFLSRIESLKQALDVPAARRTRKVAALEN